MTVREVVMLAAEELGILEEVNGYFNDGNENGKTKAERLLTCFNLVENELALDYFTLKKTDIMMTTNGRVKFSDLTYAPVHIIDVTNAENQSYEFSLYADYLQTVSGSVKVTYSYTPNKKTIDETSDFSLEVSTRLMSYGVAAEYALMIGAFEEAALWDKKYKDAISVLYKKDKCGRMTARRWA